MKIQEKEGKQSLIPEGDLTIFEAATFREALVNLHRYEGPLELDLSLVERMDSSGVQLILAGIQRGGVTLVGVKPNHREQFDRVGCGDLLRQREVRHGE